MSNQSLRNLFHFPSERARAQAYSSAEPPGASGELMASIAHEINQPLAAMVTSAETCLRWLGAERLDLERARKAAERIIRDGNYAGDVIRGLGMLSRKVRPQLTQLDVNGVILDVLDGMREEIEVLGNAPELALCDRIGCIPADRTQLRQVLANLIRNAIESMSKPGMPVRMLQVTSGLDAGGSVLITIRDSGVGLDPALIGRIFEPFFTTKSAGMGLGLSICRSLVEAHGGRLWAMPGTPCGSTFHFTLPRSRAVEAVD